jgi:rubrerythrin
MQLVETFVSEVVLVKDHKSSEGGLSSSARKATDLKKAKRTVEILKKGQECPFCGLARMKREGSEVVCPICGYGYRACT